MLDTKARKYFQPFIAYWAKLLIKMGFSANSLTILALVVGLVPAVIIISPIHNFFGVAILWLSGLLDAVDGTVARETKTMSVFGTIMDVTFDRIVEISMLIALAYKYSQNIIIFVILASSIILSMTIFLTVGAASEKVTEKTFYYQPGLAERSEGLIMFSLMMLFWRYVDLLCVIFTLMILFTAFQRFKEAYKLLK